MSDQSAASGTKGFLGWVEKTGNKLPDPVFIFFYLLIALMIISVITSLLGASATLDEQVLAGMAESQKARFSISEDGVIPAISLFSPENIQRLWVQMPETFAHFHPLGLVLTVMLGAGVAERSGLFSAAMSSAVRGAPKSLLTPVVALVAMVGNHAADAAYVVLIPLAGALFASAGRHPIAGITAAFAGVSGGFSANLTPGQLDALLFGITQEASEILAPDYSTNIAGNWFFIAAMLFVFLPIIWLVTDKVIEPRLGKYKPEGDAANSFNEDGGPLTEGQRKGLVRAGLACLATIALWALMTWGPGTPLLQDGPENAGLPWYDVYDPFFNSLVAFFLIIFLASGWAYGSAAGTIRNHRDLVNMMAEAMKDMGYYLVLAFAAAHFVAMFNWSNLGLISAVHGADAINGIKEAGVLPEAIVLPIILGLILLFSAFINLFVGSASAKWAFLAPIMIPMLMLLGISPEGATAVYRVGDSATNIITPLMVYFPLILVFAQRWQKDFGIGSLTALMIPYSIWILISGLVMTMLWVFLGLPLSFGASMTYSLPGTG